MTAIFWLALSFPCRSEGLSFVRCWMKMYRLLGNVTTIPSDRGGPTRFGLASASHPELVSQDYYDQAKVSRDAALAIAELVYEQTYATPLHIADINDQAVATAILSLGVSAWVKRPAQVIQEACVQGSYDTLPIIRTFPSELQSSALAIRLREGRLSFFGRCIAEGDCISS
jgi:Glycosyl hydrolase 108